MAIRYYRALLGRQEDGSYGVVFPELPGCVSHGEDLNDALRMATEALAVHATVMALDADPRAPCPTRCRSTRPCPIGWSRRRPRSPRRSGTRGAYEY
jgi:predicted RNase H-like HicB family nuclease